VLGVIVGVDSVALEEVLFDKVLEEVLDIFVLGVVLGVD
jgi:hypothetical protein